MGEAGDAQVHHLVHWSRHVDVVGDVSLHQAERVVLQEVLDVGRRPGQEVVHGQDLVAVGEQPLAQVDPRNPAPPVTTVRIPGV
jgi:hypothetical protein